MNESTTTGCDARNKHTEQIRVRQDNNKGEKGEKSAMRATRNLSMCEVLGKPTKQKEIGKGKGKKGRPDATSWLPLGSTAAGVPG